MAARTGYGPVDRLLGGDNSLPMSPSSTHEQHAVVKFESPRSVEFPRQPFMSSAPMSQISDYDTPSENVPAGTQAQEAPKGKGNWRSRLFDWKGKSKSEVKPDEKELC